MPPPLHFLNPGEVWRNVTGPGPGLLSPCPHNSTSHQPCPAQPTDPSAPCPGHCRPEEAPPVRVLKDVGQHSGEKPAAVQDNLLLLLRMAAALGSLHQLLDSLWDGRLGSGALALGVRMGTPGSRGGEAAGPQVEALPHKATPPHRVSQPRWTGRGPESSLDHQGVRAQPTPH